MRLKGPVLCLQQVHIFGAWGGNMYGADRIYKKVEIIGVSKVNIEAAIETALVKARASLEKLSWFEVQEIRGHIDDDGKVSEYQVVIKVAFQLKE